MQLFAHATSYEFAAGAVVFFAGTCAGVWLAHFVFSRFKARQK
jgi:hypothetical protein